jgi:hypothetical protein
MLSEAVLWFGIVLMPIYIRIRLLLQVLHYHNFLGFYSQQCQFTFFIVLVIAAGVKTCNIFDSLSNNLEKV